MEGQENRHKERNSTELKMRFEAFTATECSEVFQAHQSCKCGVTIERYIVTLHQKTSVQN